MKTHKFSISLFQHKLLSNFYFLLNDFTVMSLQKWDPGVKDQYQKRTPLVFNNPYSLCLDEICWIFFVPTYRYRHSKRMESEFMKQNADFQEGVSQAYSTATPLPTQKVLITNESIQIRYYKRIFLKGQQIGQRTNF